MRTILLVALLTFTTILAFVVSCDAQADTGVVTYEAPIEREDGTPLAPGEIGGFKVYDDKGGELMTLPAGARSFEVPAQGQTLYMTTVDTESRESALSGAVVIPQGKSAPKPLSGIIVTITIDVQSASGTTVIQPSEF